MRSSIRLAHPADLPSHGPSLIYIGYADLLRLPRTTPITQCGPIPTYRLSRSPAWSQRSFASDHCGSCRSGRRSRHRCCGRVIRPSVVPCGYTPRDRQSVSRCLSRKVFGMPLHHWHDKGAMKEAGCNFECVRLNSEEENPSFTVS
jgi:hypothetical protein